MVGAQEGDKPFQIEKWRPFYYDMFNRVGNLTVLSLKKEINQIIDEGRNVNLSFDQSDFSTVRIYWRFYKDQNLQIEDPLSSEPLSLSKAFFLYSNNQVRELSKLDFYSIMQFASEKVRDKIQYAINAQDGTEHDAVIDEESRGQMGEKMLDEGEEDKEVVVHNQTSKESLSNLLQISGRR